AEVFHWNLAQIVIRTAVAAHPDHVLTPALCLHLGNAEATGGRQAEAIGWVEQAMREKPGSSFATLAPYNTGVVQAREGEAQAARQAFLSAIDLAPGHEVAPSVYLHLARLELDDGDLRAALSHLRRGLRNYPGDDAAPALALMSAAALILGGD